MLTLPPRATHDNGRHATQHVDTHKVKLKKFPPLSCNGYISDLQIPLNCCQEKVGGPQGRLCRFYKVCDIDEVRGKVRLLMPQIGKSILWSWDLRLRFVCGLG